ncbi:MAG TPA: fructokinase, partial [Thalassospira sp.]|nr:fructokinase [Thalassospira sp.]
MTAKAVCLGELLIDFVPTVTGTGLADAPAFAKAAGGAPGNAAVGLQRLGIETGFIGKLGDDAFGHFLVDTLRADNVDTSGIV